MKRVVLLLVIIATLLSACDKNDAQPSNEMTDEADQFFSAEGVDFTGSHILIAYAGALRANPTVTRSQEEAKMIADSLIMVLETDKSAQFDSLAMKYSDGPSGVTGGSLGSWQKGRMVPAFDLAMEKLEVGEVTAEPVETDFGYHVILREENKVKHFTAVGFIVGFASPQSPPTVTRTREEAKAIADSIMALNPTSDNFDALAIAHNDFYETAMPLGVFKEGDQQSAIFADVLKDIAYNAVAGPVALPVGYAIIKRLKVEQFAGAHILISFVGAKGAGENIVRSKEEAAGVANEVLAQAQSNPNGFADLAKNLSEGPSAQTGGDLGQWFRGMMVPEFDVAIAKTEIGEIHSEIVASPFGYHIIMRNAIEQN